MASAPIASGKERKQEWKVGEHQPLREENYAGKPKPPTKVLKSCIKMGVRTVNNKLWGIENKREEERRENKSIAGEKKGATLDIVEGAYWRGTKEG